MQQGRKSVAPLFDSSYILLMLEIKGVFSEARETFYLLLNQERARMIPPRQTAKIMSMC